MNPFYVCYFHLLSTDFRKIFYINIGNLPSCCLKYDTNQNTSRKRSTKSMSVHVNSGQLNAIFQDRNYIANKADLMLWCNIMKLTLKVSLQLDLEMFWSQWIALTPKWILRNIENCEIYPRNMYSLVLVWFTYLIEFGCIQQD